MARLGELLVGSGLLTPEQLDRALRAQVMWGGRLGTNLIELGCVELDHLARALSTQHRMPAALAKHFEKLDKELQKLLSPDVAEKFSCVPLARVGPERAIVLATTGPMTPRALAIIADELVVEPSTLLPSVAAELRIRYHLERAYGIPRDTRFLRSKGKTITPFPAFDVPIIVESDPEIVPPPVPLPVPLPLPDPGPVAAVPEPVADLPSAPTDVPLEYASRESTTVIEMPEPDGRDRRRYVPTLADTEPEPEPVPEPVPEREVEPEIEPDDEGDEPKQRLGRVALRRVAVTTVPPNEPALVEPTAPSTTLAEATRAIRRAPGRDRVAELVVDALDRFAPDCQAALFLVLRNEVAIGWKGFARSGAVLPKVAVPIDQTGIVPGIVREHVAVRCAASRLAAIDTKLLHALGATGGDLAIVPITIGGQVMCMIATAVATGAPIAVTESIAAAAAAAFARLMRDASR